jgi:hypothetical protein
LRPDEGEREEMRGLWGGNPVPLTPMAARNWKPLFHSSLEFDTESEIQTVLALKRELNWKICYEVRRSRRGCSHFGIRIS